MIILSSPLNCKNQFIYFFCCLFLVVTSPTLLGQKEDHIWYFGKNSGLNFNSGSPIVLTGSAMNAFEGCASISDSEGNLLFYTDGVSVWNKNHTLMTNGSNLNGSYSSTQSSIIIPWPGKKEVYYVFTVDAFAGIAGGCACFSYSLVDLSKQGGLGEVTIKNFQLHSPITEKITAIRHRNNKDIWIIMHEWNTNAFYSYLVSESGISPPVISNTGTVHQGGAFNNISVIGYLKGSLDGKRLALAIMGLGIFEVFDFDHCSGVVSNPITLPGFNNPYGVEFSLDSKKIYGAESTPSKIYQFNLEAGNQVDIQNSKILIGKSSTSEMGALQIAPDKKIYVAKRYGQYLGVINNPDNSGVACNYVDSAVYISPPASSLYGLPNFIRNFNSPDTTNLRNFRIETTCNQTTFFIDSIAGIDSVHWEFDDVLSGEKNYSNEFNPSHIFSITKEYTIKLIMYSCMTQDTITQKIKIESTACLPFIPNLITPNKDGHNEEFEIQNISYPNELIIFNRWGDQIYQSKDYKNEWSAEGQSDGVYFYVLKLNNIEYKGWVDVKR